MCAGESMVFAFARIERELDFSVQAACRQRLRV
jgi:hypothetical protein